MKKPIAEGGSSLAYYHAVANTEDDVVAKETQNYSEKEVVFFRSLLERLLEEKYLSIDDVKSLKTADIDIQRFLERLREHGWLQRDDRNYWEFGNFKSLTIPASPLLPVVGPKVYIELKQYLEALMRDQEGSEEEMRERLMSLPQLILY